MDIGIGVKISRNATLDKSIYPQGIHIGDGSYITGQVIILTHDYCRNLKLDTYIGKKCFIGANAIIMPGVYIGDEVIIGAGAIVTKNIPSNCIAVGNPAKVISTGINLDDKCRLITKKI